MRTSIDEMARTTSMILVLVSFGALGISGAISGCATTQPWEREQLARPAMNPDGDADREDSRRHMLSTREGSSGSMGGGGGGCGCN